LLATDTSIIELNLRKTCLEDDAMDSLSNALKVNSSLKILDLSCNKIKDKGFSRLASAFRHTTTLSTLIASDNLITERCLRPIYTSLRLNASLTDFYVTLTSEAHLSFLFQVIERFKSRNIHNLKQKESTLFSLPL